jgi:hypothetical protein
MSRAFIARDCPLDDLHVLLRQRLPPFLGEPFGGGAGLVEVGNGKARDQTSHPDVDPSLSLPNVTGGASRPSLLEDHSKHNSVAEVVDLLKLELQFLIHAEPALNEGTNRGLAFEDVPQRPPLKDRIHSKAAHHRIDITAIPSLKLPAHKLNQVGGRGLLGHRPPSMSRDKGGGRQTTTRFRAVIGRLRVKKNLRRENPGAR